MNALINSGAKSATLKLTIIRADGTTQDLGVVSVWHKSPLARLAWRISRIFKG